MTYVYIAEIIGVLLVSYGVLRESLAVLVKSRPYGEGRYDEGVYGGAPTPTTRRVVAVGVFMRRGPPFPVPCNTAPGEFRYLRTFQEVLEAVEIVAGTLEGDSRGPDSNRTLVPDSPNPKVCEPRETLNVAPPG